MSRMSEEILLSMSEFVTTGAGQCVGAFKFTKTFVGFQGHFENKPILPGICKIQATLVMCEKKYGVALDLKEVVSAKYMLPVSCEEMIVVESNDQLDDFNQVHVRATISKDEKKVAMLKLVLERKER